MSYILNISSILNNIVINIIVINVKFLRCDIGSVSYRMPSFLEDTG